MTSKTKARRTKAAKAPKAKERKPARRTPSESAGSKPPARAGQPKPARRTPSNPADGTPPARTGKPKPARRAAPRVECDSEALAFIEALERFKKEHQRPFPSWSEVLFVLKSLGYRKV